MWSVCRRLGKNKIWHQSSSKQTRSAAESLESERSHAPVSGPPRARGGSVLKIFLQVLDFWLYEGAPGPLLSCLLNRLPPREAVLNLREESVFQSCPSHRSPQVLVLQEHAKALRAGDCDQRRTTQL